MAETPFKIKTGIELDTEKAREEFKKFSKDIKDLKDFKMNLEITSNAKSVTDEIKELNKQLKELKKNNKINIEVNTVTKNTTSANTLNVENIVPNFNDKEIIAKYKNVFSTIKKLNQQISKGVSDDDAYDTFWKVKDLEETLSTLKNKIGDLNKLNLFNFKEDNAEIVKTNQQILTLTSGVEKLETKLNSINFKNVSSENITSGLTKILNDLEAIKNSNGLNIDIAVGETLNNISNLEKQLKNLAKVDNLKEVYNNIINNLDDDVKDRLGETYFSDIESQLRLLENSTKTVDGTFDRLADKIRDSLNNVKNDVRNATSEINRELSREINLDNTFNNLEDKFNSLKVSLNSINFKNVDTSSIDNRIVEITERIEELQRVAREDIDFELNTRETVSELNDLKNQINNLKELDKIKGEFSQLEEQLRSTFGNDYVDDLSRELLELENNVLNVDGTFSRLGSSIRDSLSQARNDLRSFQNELSSTNNSNRNSFLEDFYDSTFASVTAGEVVGEAITNIVSDVKDAYIEMDAAMTNIKKVADENEINSVEKLENIKNTAIDVAKEVGKSSSDVMNAISDTIQAGIGDMQTSIDVAKQTMMLANVGDIDQETASSAVNTMINGFNIDAVTKFKKEINGTQVEVTELTQTMDALNHASNNYGTDTQKLLDGLQNGATVLGSYGVSIEDTIALMTAGIEVLGNGNKVGRVLPTINSAKSVN